VPQTNNFLFKSLNNEQLQAVKHVYGPLLVVAGAGSGKTKALTHRIANLIEGNSIDPYNILAVTFTNKAAKEMKARLEVLLAQQLAFNQFGQPWTTLKEIDQNQLRANVHQERLQNLWIGTFHSLFSRLLRYDIEKYTDPEGLKWTRQFSIYDETDSQTLVKEIISQDMNLDPKRFDPKKIKRLISNAKNQSLTSNDLLEKADKVRLASIKISQTENQNRIKALNFMADYLEKNSNEILDANNADYSSAQKKGISKALLSRLKLSKSKLNSGIEGVRKVGNLADPVNQVQIKRELAKGLILERKTVPIGVLGVIFESRPDAVMQISSLAIRSGNGVMLKGGSEANLTNTAIVKALQEGLNESGLDKNAICLLTSRKDSMAMLNLEKYINLIIPRGSNELVKFIQENTRIPVLGLADGICH